MSSQPLVSVVIVNYNSACLLKPCLASIQSQSLQDYEIIVVDNASGDDSMVHAETFGHAHTIYNPTNFGFAAGQNLGIQHAKGAYVLALNFDIRLEPDFLANMIEIMYSCPDAGTVSGKLLRMTPKGEVTNIIDNAGLLLPSNRLPIHRGKGQVDVGQFDGVEAVFGAMGAAALYRREMLDDIAYRKQYFDETFFTWYEDIDLDWRGRMRGWQCVYTPNAVAYHIGDPQGHRGSPFHTAMTVRNRWLMIVANEDHNSLYRNRLHLAAEEVALLRYAIRSRLLLPYVSAVRSFGLFLPSVLEKRKWVQNRATHSLSSDYPIPVAQGERLVKHTLTEIA